MTKPFGDPGVIEREGARIDALALRVLAADPLRVCDDFENWDWRAYIKKRRG